MPKGSSEKKNLFDESTKTPPEKPTFQTVCNKWLEYKKKVCSPQTLKCYQSKVKQNLLQAPFADKPINIIDRKNIEQWVADLKRTRTNKCIYTTLNLMNYIFKHPLKMRLTENDHTRMVKFPKPEVKYPEPFKKDEVEKFLDNVDPFYQDYQKVIFFSGKRITEINELIPSDIDLKGSNIWIGLSNSHGHSHDYKKCRKQLMNKR